MKLPTHVRHVRETGSTNHDLLALLREGTPSITAILTDHQTAGRGRLGRRWHDDDMAESSPAAGLTPQAMMGSISFRWDEGHAGLPLVPFAAGLATLDLVVSVLGSESGVGLGWPNDVIVQRDDRWRKLAGILVESVPLPEPPTLGVVVGVGLNLWPVVRSDPEVRSRAISVAELFGDNETGRSVVSNVVAFGRLLTALEVRLSDLRTDPRSLMSAYRASCVTLGQRVEFQTSDGPATGVARDVVDTGEILVETSAGSVAVSVGDVQPL
ncbi:MAG: biotin--[acetyl-CoA-carboxylase] ligase [Acidimicrobiales bacterium]